MNELNSLYINHQKLEVNFEKVPHWHLKGLIGSSKNFAISALVERTDRTFILIEDDFVNAIYSANDLETLLGKEKVLVFPSSIKTSFLTDEIKGIESSNLLLRTEVLSKINEPQGKVIVTYPSAIIEEVVREEEFEKSSLLLTKGEKLDTQLLEEFLIEYGFERVDFVSEPGQYAIRGGIVDIFSVGNEEPFRIEFFGDEIESIRTFDIENQLSVNELNSIKIIPDLHTKVSSEKISFLEFIDPNNSTLVFNDLKTLLAFLEKNSKKKFSLVDSHGENIVITYSDHKIFEKLIPQFSTIELSNLSVLQGKEVKFNISPQPSYHKNFKLLVEQLRQYQQIGYKLFILSQQKKQLDRIEEILQSDEIGGKDIKFQKVNQTIKEGFVDHDLKLVLFTDHQIFGRYHRYKLRTERLNKKKENTLIKELQSLKPGDYVVHIDYGIGKFAGLMTINNNGKQQEVLKIVYRDGDAIYVPIHGLYKVSKYKGKDGQEPRLNKLGTPAWQNLKAKAKKKVKDIAKDLIALYAKRLQEQGFAFSPDSYLQEALEASFMYEDTPDQAEATKAVKADMEKPVPMDRLICGDVGFGKTEIAIRAAFKAVADNKQVAVLCPTTVLAFQHFKTFSERLKDFPVTIDFLTRLKTTKEQRLTLKRLEEGKIDIIIGTHRLLSKDVKFKDLGLLIIDEEQKFGVAAKERLRQLRVNVDTLTLTATPIPRTLQFSLMGARDLSIITTPPPNRRPIITEVHSFDKEIIKKAICYELSREGQVFFVHNHVDTLPRIAELITELCPHARVAIAHGRMKPSDVENIMTDFINYEYDVLVTTTIIENGLDIPNANTIIINDAHKFGLSDLHQLRGRVGRSDRQAFCYLLAPPKETLTQNAKRRLQTIEQFVELGSGFNIALQDLDIRGAGNLLGAEQSGFINEMGYETFRRILEEAVLELKNEEFKDLFKEQTQTIDSKTRFVTDCQISTDIDARIPKQYVENDAERLRLYHKLNSLNKESELEQFIKELTDRFGPIPIQVNNLLNIVRLRWLAMDLAIEKIVLKQKQMINYFVSDPKSQFYDSMQFQKLLHFISRHKNLEFKQKDNKLYLKYKNVPDIDAALKNLKQLHKFIFGN